MSTLEEDVADLVREHFAQEKDKQEAQGSRTERKKAQKRQREEPVQSKTIQAEADGKKPKTSL